jgi:hypothetical protein
MTVAPGQRVNIRAADWNDILAMLGQWRANGRRGTYFPDELGKSQPLPGGWCWIKNNHTSNVAAFGVLGLDGVAIDFSTTANAHHKFAPITLKGVQPSTSTPHYGKYAVLQEPAKASGGIARAVIFGPAVCSLSITHASDRAAEIENSQTHLKTGYVGTSRILWMQSGTGTGKLGIVRVGDSILQFFGKPAASIALDATTGTVNAWKADFTGSALGPTVTNCCNFTRALTTSDKVSGVVDNGVAVIGPLNCP